jgi:hypothetical protein
MSNSDSFTCVGDSIARGAQWVTFPNFKKHFRVPRKIVTAFTYTRVNWKTKHRGFKCECSEVNHCRTNLTLVIKCEDVNACVSPH